MKTQEIGEKSRMLGDFRKTEATKCCTRSSFLFYSETDYCIDSYIVCPWADITTKCLRFFLHLATLSEAIGSLGSRRNGSRSFLLMSFHGAVTCVQLSFLYTTGLAFSMTLWHKVFPLSNLSIFMSDDTFLRVYSIYASYQ